MFRWFLLLALSLSLLPPAAQAQNDAPVPCHVRAPTPAATTSLPLPATMMGMVIRDPWYEFNTHPQYPNQPNYVFQSRMGELLAAMGVRTVRFEFRVNDPSQLEAEIARNDYFIRVVAPANNLQVLGLLGFGLVPELPPLELNATTFLTDTVYGGAVNLYMQLWLDRARTVVNRYAGDVHAYEILNEQNRLPVEAGGPNGINAASASRLHTKFYRFFRVVDRTQPNQTWRDAIPILIGGLHPKGTWEPNDPKYISDRRYIAQYYGLNLDDGSLSNAAPFREYQRTYGCFPADGLAYHPYPEEIRLSLAQSSDLIAARLDAVRAVLRQAGEPTLPYWITEIGYNAAYLNQNEAGQAQFMESVFRSMAARGDVATIYWFKYEDFPPLAPRNPFDRQQWGIATIPFSDGPCPGGCYDPNGEPLRLRHSSLVYRMLAGAPIEQFWIPMLIQAN